jgi:hypothetical protein
MAPKPVQDIAGMGCHHSWCPCPSSRRSIVTAFAEESACPIHIDKHTVLKQKTVIDDVTLDDDAYAQRQACKWSIPVSKLGCRDVLNGICLVNLGVGLVKPSWCCCESSGIACPTPALSG